MNIRDWLANHPNAGLMIFATFSTAVVAVIFLTNWPTYHYQILGGPIPLWYYVLPGVFILPVIFAEPQSAVRFFREPMFWWFVVYVATGLVWLLFAQNFIEDANQFWRLRVLAFFYFYTVTLLAFYADRRLAAWAIIGCVLIAGAFNWIDLMRPYRFVPHGIEDTNVGRGAGLYLNPNAAASFITLGALAALPLIPMRFRALLIAAAVVGVAPTLSRSGLIYVSMLALGSIAVRLVNRTQTLIMLTAVALLAVGLVVSYDFLMQAADDPNLHNVLRRLSWFDDLEDDDSSQARRHAAANAWRMFIENPLTGSGIGATMLAILVDGPHNMYLTLGAEQGLLGLGLYIALIVILAMRGRRLARTAMTAERRDVGRALMLLAAVLAAYGLFSHNVLEEAQTIFIIAFLVAAGFQAPREVSAASMAVPAIANRRTVGNVSPRPGQL